ncbi:hypothetical protein ASG29_07575 [Sphingomonas sp. Leaf412]|uniref:hypothetical protein n=1 Tax=Sphingomonas sp. Leaf412 TaxID=1736370 RepID=UPI0006F1DD10|nr:hypothetical protein [Sphingomonas sp. Leaf412]KQT31767.1 hypothetical protein ASG29_07575 [Sphingomonas sp. Leaf412]
MGLTHAQIIARLGEPTSGATDHSGGTIYFETPICSLMIVERAGVVIQVLGISPDSLGIVEVPVCLAALGK